MRSVIPRRSRPGRPRWQLTTRPATAAMLGVVSLVAAGAQLSLFASPTPWYQWAVAGFWAAVGLAFLASAAGTRSRARRAAAARRRVPVDPVPFVPVPIRPARPRRRDEAGRAVGDGDPGEVDTGEPTDDLADAVLTAVTPVVTATPPRSTAAGHRREAASAESSTAARRRRTEPAEPTIRTRNRHAVRAVRSVETASREIPLPVAAGVPAAHEVSAAAASEHPGPERPGPAGSTSGATVDAGAIRDGRVRPVAPDPRPPATGSRRPVAPETRRPLAADPPRPTTTGSRPAAAPSAPSGAVPSPRAAPERARPGRDDRPGSPPTAGGSDRPASRMTFGSGEGGRVEGYRHARRPTDTGRHALAEPREVPAPRDGDPAPRRARHAAPAGHAKIR